jgi:selenocysteine lyase/cysteine desulfurase
MGIKNIHDREEELTKFVFKELNNIPNLKMLAGNITSRLPIFSFYIEDIHHNIIVKALNDYFGIQTRGGCSCCGTYGHYLLGVDFKKSQMITEQIDMGNNIEKPGWIRASLHPTTTNDEAAYICSSVKTIAADIEKYRREYSYHQETDSFIHNKHGDVPVGENLFSI